MLFDLCTQDLELDVKVLNLRGGLVGLLYALLVKIGFLRLICISFVLN